MRKRATPTALKLLAVVTAMAVGLTISVSHAAGQTSVGCDNGAAVPDPAGYPALVNDCKALLASRTALTGNAWVNWSARTAIAAWEGVTVSGGRVVALEISGQELNGSLPPHLGSLDALTALDLSDNELTGALPAHLGNLASLSTLDLSGNGLTGAIPVQLGLATSLTTLDLSGNQLSGTIPTQLSLLTSLTTLDLSGNQLSGTIPAHIGHVAGLEALDISGNRLTGKMPDTIGLLSALRTLDLSDNRLSGDITTSFLPSTPLSTIDLSGNRLTGRIKAQLFFLAQLRSLDLSDNQLSGWIPPFQRPYPPLEFLSLSDNHLTGEFSASLGQLNGLATLRLAGNKFTGCIPESLQTIADNDIVSGGLWICGTEPPVRPRPPVRTGPGGGGGGGDEGDEGGEVTIIVANGWSPPDIGVAAALAARTPDSAVLYTHPDHVPAGVVNLLAGLSVARVVVVGGAAAVGEQTVQALTHAAKNARTDRVAGIDRVSTAVDAARSALSSAARSTIIVANGWSPPDIGVAAALAARTPDSAVLYTHPDHVPAGVVNLLAGLSVARVVVVGGAAAVGEQTVQALTHAAKNARTDRVAGIDRVSTAVDAARSALSSAARSTIIVANGWSPPDIGVAAALAARTPDSAVLYTHLGMLADAVVALLRSEAPAVVRIVGGNAAVPAHIKDAIKAILPDGARVIRYSGPTRTSTAIAVARLSLQS